MNFKIGVIIPAYLPTDNYINFLDYCVDSVKQQSYKNIKTAIVYNGPITKEYTDCININLKTKTSASVARNVGASLLHDCDYLCFLDADDSYFLDKIEKQLEFQSTNNIDFCFTGIWHMDELSNLKDKPMNCETSYTTYELEQVLPFTNVLALSSSMIKTEKFFKSGMFVATNEYNIGGNQYHLNTNNNIYEDYYLWSNALTKGYSFYKLGNALTKYRINTSVER
jgi:glycosyltransferase involved in cell wall biosynthesis